jgi:Tol biopolymer transport system component
MSLASGSRLGPYEIIAALGAGGMGEVYHARDTRLHRDVAMKVLPDDVAEDPERLARFEREARTLAALNHPHIAQIHGLEGRALVMELVAGDDLAARIAAGPMPVADAISIARQVALALDAAHTAGIVHRDLKPANVKVRPDGVVKVLDFGLAKIVDGPASTAGAVGPTVTTPAMTRMGIILGTAAYMSPEQARGHTVDKRTDVWAFGCVLYEMLTGRAAFGGDTITDVLGSIVKSEPDWTTLPRDTPPGIRRLLHRCLQKDVAKRLRDIGDAVEELEPGQEGTMPTPSPAPGATSGFHTRRTRPAWTWMAAVVLVGAATAAVGYFARPAPEPRLQKFHIAIQQAGGVIREPVISPDGRRVVFVGRSGLYVQALDEWEPRELAGTVGATRPFWSPAGDWIGYFRSEQLLKVPSAGGQVVRVGRLPAVQAPLGNNSGAWGEDGFIVISLAAGPLLRVPGGGGDVKEYVQLPPEVALDLHDLDLLPGGALLVAVHRATGVNALGVVKDGSLRIVLEISNVGKPSYVSTGHLIFERRAPNAGLWAVRFALDRLEVTGEPFLIGHGTEPSVARDGTLAFLGQPEAFARQLAWFSLEGQVGARIAEPREWTEGFSVSLDGRQLLAAASDGIWAYDVDTGARSRITTGQTDITPCWIDHDRFVFIRSEGGQPVLVTKRAVAGGDERVLARRARFPRVTADGRRVVFNIQMEGRPGWEVAWIDFDRPADVHRLGPAHWGARFPSVSPDGTLVAYVSGEMGDDQIFLTRLPSGEGKWQLSTDGGGWTLFSPAGDWVAYRAPDGAFMSVPIATERGELKIGQPRKLFDWGAAWLPSYEFARDGRRGVTAVPTGAVVRASSLSIVQNWLREFPAAR